MKKTILFILLGFSTIGFAQNCNEPNTNFKKCDVKAIGHRGYSEIYPENSLIALEEAFKRGIKYCEIDVNVTRDSVVVLFHDQPRMYRTSSGTGAILWEYFEDIENLDYGSWKGEQFEGTPIATLEQALILADEYDAFLYLDTKSFSPALYAEILFRTKISSKRLIPALGSMEEIDSLKHYIPNASFVFFGDWTTNIINDQWYIDMIDKGCIAFEIYYETALDDGPAFRYFRDKVHEFGAELWVFTTNVVSEFIALAELGVDGIETDRPHAMAAALCNDVVYDYIPFNQTTGNWTFENGNTLGQGIGSRFRSIADSANLQNPSFGSTEDFGINPIQFENAQVMQVPAFDPENGILVYNNFIPETDGGLQYEYSIVMDLYIPLSSYGNYISILQTNPDNANDADLFISPTGGIGVTGNYHGAMLPDTWHRIVLAVQSGRIDKYIDGIYVGVNNISGARWSLVNTFPGGQDQGMLLFADNDGETQELYLAALQIRNYTMGFLESVLLGLTEAVGIATNLTGIYYPLSDHINNVSIDWASKSIYIDQLNMGDSIVELSFTLPYGATASTPILNAQINVALETNIIEILAEDGVNKTEWSVCSNYQRVDIVEEDPISQIDIFPNPSASSVKINWANENVTDLEIYNVNGAIVYHEKIGFGTQGLDLNLQIESGVYFVYLKSHKKELVEKWVKL